MGVTVASAPARAAVVWAEHWQRNMSEKLAVKLAKAEAVLVDLDGCLASANRPLPGAVRFAEAMGERLYIVSNNSTHEPEALSRELSRRGLKVPPRRILLAGALAVDCLARERPGARVLLAGSKAISARAERQGLKLTDQGAQVVLLARDTAFSYERLQVIARSLAKGAGLIAANPDLTHPGPDGRPVPETGALLAAVRAVAPKALCRIIGKPEPEIYIEALARAGVAAHEALMIGDNPATDIAGARALGMPGILIGAHEEAQVAGIGDLL